jgi:4'-phosphopantetheinyl transferase N-terminal domain
LTRELYWGTVTAALIHDRIAALFDAPVVVVEGPQTMATSDLFPEEREHVMRAVPKRQAEFGTARVYARRALAQLGVPPVSLHPLADRSPRWPEGVVGTITHCEAFCAVAVARAADARGIGLDAEPDVGLEPALERYTCTPHERRLLDEPSALDRSRREARVLREGSVLQVPISHDGDVSRFPRRRGRLQLAAGRFSVRVVGPTLPRARLIEGARGRFDVVDGLVLAAATL